MNRTLLKELAACKQAMKNRSPKPLARLRASLADIRYTQLINELPGSTRRGLARGHIELT